MVNGQLNPAAHYPNFLSFLLAIGKRTWLATEEKKKWATAFTTGVALLTTSGAELNPGDAWCILSAILFGVHKWRSEQITAKFDNTLPLVGVQILVLAVLSTAFCIPSLLTWVQSGGLSDIVETTSSLPWP